MLKLEIQDDVIQASFQEALDAMLKPGTYSNPIKNTLDTLLGYNGSMKGKLGEQIEAHLEKCMDDEKFQAMLGKAIAEEMARRSVDALEKKNK